MSFLENIKNKIKKKFNPENLVLIDNSHLHSKHKFFDANKSHLKLIITSQKLRKMDKILAHKEIFSVLKDEMNTSIHALEIIIN